MSCDALYGDESGVEQHILLYGQVQTTHRFRSPARRPVFRQYLLSQAQLSQLRSAAAPIAAPPHSTSRVLPHPLSVISSPPAHRGKHRSWMFSSNTDVADGAAAETAAHRTLSALCQQILCLSFLPAPNSYKIHQSSLGWGFLMQLITAEVHHKLPS